MADASAGREIADLDLYDITAAQLAVDGEVEQGSIAKASPMFQEKRIAQTSLSFSAFWVPTTRPAFHGRRSS